MQIPQLACLLLDTDILLQDREAVVNRNAHFQHLVYIAFRKGIVGRQIEEYFVYPFMADPGKDILPPSIDRHSVDFRHIRCAGAQKFHTADKEITERTFLQFLDHMCCFGIDRDDEQGSLTGVLVILPPDSYLVQGPGQIRAAYEEDRDHDKEAPGDHNDLMDGEQIDDIREHNKESVLYRLHELFMQDHQDDRLISVENNTVSECQMLQNKIT